MEKKFKTFEDLIIWKESMNLSIEIYKLFKNCRDFGFRDQVQRSSISVPSNIAEGFERQSDKEFIRSLFIAKGSNGELRTQLYLAMELSYIDKEIGLEKIEKARQISAMIYSLIKVRRTSILKPLLLSLFLLPPSSFLFNLLTLLPWFTTTL